ncbi:MAG: hypothetical protein NTX64_17995 [Elusimicrobia bacterium]|nr:hypothetical protein [Elusimicrobiota bacterium]
MAPRNRLFLPFICIAFTAAIAAAQAATLDEQLSRAGILDRTMLSGKANATLDRLYKQATNKNPSTAKSGQQSLDAEIRKDVGPYRAYQTCQQALDDGDDTSKILSCSEFRLAQMEGVIDVAMLQNLRYQLNLVAAPGSSCDQDQRLACQVDCFSRTSCDCCRL